MADTTAMRQPLIAEGLRRLGLGEGEHVLVHSSLSSLGVVEGGAEAVIDALLEVVGSRGTVMVPTFGTKEPVFDSARSETSLGAIPRAFWKRPQAVRSLHPLASVAAIGSKAAWLIDGHEEARTAHGELTPYHRLAEIRGKILLLGVDQDRSTFLHTAEELSRLPYLRPQAGSYLDRAGATVSSTWQLFPGPHRAFIGVQAWLEDRGLVRKAAIGSCVAQLMDAAPLLEALLARLKGHPGLFISENPNLPDGIWQRAALLRAELDRESFTLAADSSEGRHTLEELTRSLERAGIRHVVLSAVGGALWPAIAEQRRKWYLQGLSLAGAAVAAVRLERLEPDRAVELAREAGTDTIIVPSTVPLRSVAALCARGIRVLVENRGLLGAELLELLGSAPLADRAVAVAFDPLAALAVGENPFLTTFSKTRLRLHMGLLYAADGLATGERTPLGSGLGEIAELLSMLRASHFRGLVVLRGTAEVPLEAESASFMALLRSLGRPE